MTEYINTNYITSTDWAVSGNFFCSEPSSWNLPVFNLWDAASYSASVLPSSYYIPPEFYLPPAPALPSYSFDTSFLWEMPSFTSFNAAPAWNTSFTSNPSFDTFTKSSTISTGKKSSFSYNSKVSGSVSHSYLTLSKSAAYKKAKTDSNLEELKGGKGWSVSETSFITDIPFAKKGTGAILEKVAAMTGENLTITSALGTGEAGNPHQTSGYASHHNSDNPKLDISVKGKNAAALAKKLKDTGYFCRVSVEGDHLDVQIDPDKYALA